MIGVGGLLFKVTEQFLNREGYYGISCTALAHPQDMQPPGNFFSA
jgi:hypothetical protein